MLKRTIEDFAVLFIKNRNAYSAHEAFKEAVRLHTLLTIEALQTRLAEVNHEMTGSKKELEAAEKELAELRAK